MLVRPRLCHRFHVTLLPGEGVFLLSEHGSHRLQGDVIEALVPLLDGTRDVAELSRDLSPRFQASEVFYALMELHGAGLLTEGSDPSTSGAIYWEMLGTSDAEARTRLLNAEVEVREIGCRYAELATAALERNGIRSTPGGGTMLVLTNDYQNPSLAEIDEACRAEGRTWLLARLSGATAWIGPLFISGDTGCWLCLEHRLRGNRPLADMIRQKTDALSPPAVARAAVQASVEAALGLLIARLVAWLGTGDSTHLAGVITTLDAVSSECGTHRLFRRPQCPGCGDPQLYTRCLDAPVELTDGRDVAWEDGGYRVVGPQETAHRFEDLVSPITGVVRDVRPVEIQPGSPVRLYVASHAGPALSHPRARFHGVAGESGAGGKGLTDQQARASALGEAIERASGVFQGDEVSLRASYDELDDRAIHPNDCMLFSDAQYQARAEGLEREGGMNAVPFRFDPTVELDWTSVWSLTEERHKYLTTQYLYFAHPGPVEHTFSFADSNGNAAGNTLEEAVLQGLLEVIERDAVSLWWYNRLRMRRVDLTGLTESRIRALLSWYECQGREVEVLDLTTDIGVPVLAAVSRVVTGGPEQILVGFGSHLDGSIALARAVTEMNQVLAILDRLDASRGRLPPDLYDWLTKARLEDHPHLLPAQESPIQLAPSERPPADIMEHVRECQGALESAGLEVLVLDQTRPDLRIPVVKVIVPGLRHFWARFAPGRLYDVPVSLGLLEKVQAEEELNPLPMFL